MHELKLLLASFSNTSFYLLGAGASAGIVPMTHQLKNRIIEDHSKLWGYNFDIITLDEFSQRIIGEVPNQDFLLNRISTDFVRANTIYQLSKHHWQEIKYCPQYDVFNFAKKPSTIFTANLDGLADRLNQQHFVYHFHGIIPKYYGSEIFYRFMQDYFSEFDSLNIKMDNALLIEKESTYITFTIPYISARNQHIRSKYFVIIGYSFGKNAVGLDDTHTFNYVFKDLYTYNRTPILIIAPDNTYELINQIQDTIKSSEVYALNMYWDCLSKAIIDYNLSFNRQNKSDTYYILDRYHFYEDLK